MAHEVKFTVNKAPVDNNDFTFEVHEIDTSNKRSKIGTLMISTGNLSWKPKNNEKKVIKIKWLDFAELVEDHGKLKPQKIKLARKPATKGTNPNTSKSINDIGSF